MNKIIVLSSMVAVLMGGGAAELENGAEFSMEDVPEELTVQVRRGGSVRFLVEENGTTGYQWEATYASNECAVVIEHRGANAPNGLCGAPGKAAFTVTKNAAVQSPSLVEFSYRRPWERTDKSVRSPKTVRLVLYTIPGEQADFRYPASRTLNMLKAECKNRGIKLVDWHVHIRGGLTPEMAAEREKACGFRQSAMENHGREWEIFDNARLVAFAEKARAVKVNGHTLPVGIQVNDRDWFRQIDAATRAKFDYILADTMIMGKLPNGRDRRLWLVRDISEIGDPEQWMDEYVAMNLQILGEPISILANPGYLPAPLDALHDRLWTEKRMRQVIGKAVERGIAIEIQAESPYPSVGFLKLAKSMGAKFSFGTNNYDAAPKDLSRWLEAIVWLDLKGSDIWTPKCLRSEGGAVAASCALAAMEPATPESQGVSSRGILNWIDACEKQYDGVNGDALHGFVIVRHGKVIAEGSWKPFDTLNEPHMLYSHSKSFTSTAVGFAVDEGKLDLDERVAGIFKSECPTNVSENLAQLRVRDLLTMNVGKKAHDIRGPESWVRQFLSKEFKGVPGGGFRYDSDATYMLAAIVEKRTGMQVADYLKSRLFDKIGITSAWTTVSPQGVACGGWGWNMTTRDMARFGQFYLQKGAWNGAQLLSSDWISLATTRQTWSGGIRIQNETIGSGSDWAQGYGFQFWRCRHGAYRADGASGQFTIVLPEQDAVVSIHAGLGDMQKELDLVWDHLLPAMGAQPLPEDVATQAKLKDRLAALALPLPGGIAGKVDAAACGKTLELKENGRGFKSVRVDARKDGWLLTVVTRAGTQKIPVGCRRWEKGSMRIDPERYEDLSAYIGEHPTAAAGGVREDGSLCVRIYLTGTPGRIDLVLHANGLVGGGFRAMRGCEFQRP